MISAGLILYLAAEAPSRCATEKMQFWSTILATIVGGILAIGGGFIASVYQRGQERKSLRAALRAEIQAILVIVERRKYIAGLTDFIETIKGGSTDLMQIRTGKDYDVVFRSNCDKLGLLSSATAARTVRFYRSVSSIKQDTDLLLDAADKPNLQARYRLNTKAGNLAFHEEILKLSKETIALGNDLIRELA